MYYPGYFPKPSIGISISTLTMQGLAMQSNGWKLPTIRLQRSGWTVVLKAKGLLTGSLKKNTRFHRVSTEEHYMRILERK